MNTPETPRGTYARLKWAVLQSVHVFYKSWIEPKSEGEDSRRKERIFNIIASSLFIVVFFLDLSVLWADVTRLDKGGFHFFTFSVFVVFFGGLLLLSRKGHTELASYLFLGLYFLATTWGVYIWGTAVPLSLLSYGAIIVMTSILLGTRSGFATVIIICATLITLGFLETHGIIKSDLTWRYKSLEFKDTLEDSFVYTMIVVISWLSNKEIETSLIRARKSEKSLREERDFLEVKVDERTKELKSIELEKVSQLYRFVEFGRLASGIFHDLINPLSAVALSVEKLNDNQTTSQPETFKKEQKDVKEYIDKAVRASKRMEVFMQTAKKQLDSRERNQDFSVRKEILDSIDLLIHKSRKISVPIVFLDSEDIVINGNPVKFFQISVNLISNAIDAYAEKIPSEENTVIVSISRSEQMIRFSVKDKGCGIKDSLRKSIFEPFFTTKQDRPRSESGFGLGLSTTKDIVEKEFSGSIELETIENQGSTFTVVIPISKHNAEKQSHKNSNDPFLTRESS